jgi:hypothetical protein
VQKLECQFPVPARFLHQTGRELPGIAVLCSPQANPQSPPCETSSLVSPNVIGFGAWPAGCGYFPAYDGKFLWRINSDQILATEENAECGPSRNCD